jgi:hypothetical protein
MKGEGIARELCVAAEADGKAGAQLSVTSSLLPLRYYAVITTTIEIRVKVQIIGNK